jgi:hypothetical protein
MGITPSHIIMFSPRLSDEIKAWNKQIDFLQTERDDLLNLKSRVKVLNFTIMRLEQLFAIDTSVFEELEEARKAHVVLLKREMEADPATSRLDRRVKVIYKRIGRRVGLCHKHVNWFLSKSKFVLFPSFRADEKLLSRTKNNPLPKSCKSVLTHMAALCHLMTLNGGVLIDPSESCATIIGACCGTMCSPGLDSTSS